MLLAVLIVFRNYAKIMLLSQNYALCHWNYATYILRKEKITSTILTLMNIHIVHLPVSEQSSASQYASAHLEKPNDQQMISKSTVSESGSESYSRILVLEAIQAKPSVH